jgi:hypothetical protein
MASIVPSSDSSGSQVPPPMGPGAPPSNFSPDTSQDAWAKMLGPTATPQQVNQFKEAVIRALNSQMAHERDRMIKALRRMRKEEE